MRSIILETEGNWEKQYAQRYNPVYRWKLGFQDASDAMELEGKPAAQTPTQHSEEPGLPNPSCASSVWERETVNFRDSCYSFGIFSCGFSNKLIKDFVLFMFLCARLYVALITIISVKLSHIIKRLVHFYRQNDFLTFYIHRLVKLSPLIKEASFCNRRSPF